MVGTSQVKTQKIGLLPLPPPSVGRWVMPTLTRGFIILCFPFLQHERCGWTKNTASKHERCVLDLASVLTS